MVREDGDRASRDCALAVEGLDLAQHAHKLVLAE